MDCCCDIAINYCSDRANIGQFTQVIDFLLNMEVILSLTITVLVHAMIHNDALVTSYESF